MGSGDTDAIDSNGDLFINGGTLNINARSPFDYDREGKLSESADVTVNGEKVTALTNQFGGGFGGFGGRNGNAGDGTRPEGQEGFDGKRPEDFDGQFQEGADGRSPRKFGRRSEGENTGDGARNPNGSENGNVTAV